MSCPRPEHCGRARHRNARRVALALGVAALVGPLAAAAPTGLVRLSERAWAYVATDERSSNGALFVGDDAALVVDPGLTPGVAHAFLQAARGVTDRPIRWAVLTHWHPDHSLGAACALGRESELVAHPATRRALAENGALVRQARASGARDTAEREALAGCALRLPDHAVSEREVFELGSHAVEVFHPGPAHTRGDLVVWSAAERVLVTGDLFLHDSAPSMGEGNTRNWIDALQRLADLAPRHVVPGHFAPATVADLQRFRAYLAAQVEGAEAGLRAGLTPDAIAARVSLPAFTGFAQYPQYEATFADNARTVARELAARPAARGATGGFEILTTLDVGLAPHQISWSADGRSAWIAAAGSDRIARVDVASRTLVGAVPVDGTPLGVVELESGELAVARFRGERLSRLPAAGGAPSADIDTGQGASLVVGPLPDRTYLVSVEETNSLLAFDGRSFERVGTFPTGKRPFPPAATSDGRKAFVPGYDDGSVTVVDLWNRRVLTTVAVGAHPSGGALLPGDVEYAVAVRGENRIAFVNTASHQVVGSLSDGIGEGPFSVVVSPDGRFAFVNNTGSHDISVIRLASRGERRVVARIPVGEIPIVMAVHPSGETLWVACEGGHRVQVIAIPQEPAPAPASAASEKPTEVAVLGMIHDGHRTSPRWGLAQVRETLKRLAPDVVCAEIPPDRFERVWRDYTERGLIEDERVARFPEYTDVLLPLAVELGFTIEPCAAWTREMSDLREVRVRQFEHDPAFAARHAEYTRASAEVEARHAQTPIVEDDPRVIHSTAYDERTREELSVYDRFLNEPIGPGGWTHINEAHLRLIDAALARHRGRRVVITFGAGHKYWFLDRLRQRDDVRLLDVTDFLPTPARP